MLKKFETYQVFQEIRNLRKIGLPIIVAQLLLMSISVTDTIMAGNYSSNALAAVAVGTSLMLPLYILLMGILMAISPMVSHHIGGRKLRLVGRDVRQGLLLSQFLAFPFVLVTRELSHLMIWMDVAPEIIPLTDAYLKAFAWGAIPAFAYLVLRFFNEGLGNTLPGMWVAFVGLLFNIPANYVLIYGKFGLPALGSEGCGYASSIVGLVLFLSMYIYCSKTASFERFKLFSWKEFSWQPRVLKEILKLGTPIGFTSTMEVTAFAAVSLIMANLGTQIVAAHQIAINIAAVVYMIPFGLSMGITTRVGKAMGAKNYMQARFRGQVGILLSLGIMVFTAIFLFSTRKILVGIYTDDEAVYGIAVQLLLLAAFFQLSDGLQVAGYGALKGLKDTRIPMYVNFVAYWLIGIPTGYALGIYFEQGPWGLWIGLISGLTMAALLHNLRFNILTKRFIHTNEAI